MGASAGLTRSVQPTTNTTPATGGKGAASPVKPMLPPPGQSSGVPPQGGKGQNFGPNVFPAPQVQQPQVPAQGGKMSPLIQQVLNNQQQAQIQQPQVQQPLVQQRDPQVQPGLLTQNQMLTSPGQSQADAYKSYITAAMNNPQQPQVMPPQITNYGPGSFPQQPLVQQPQGLPARPPLQQMDPAMMSKVQQMAALTPQVQQPFSGFPQPMLPPGVQMPVGLPARPPIAPPLGMPNFDNRDREKMMREYQRQRPANMAQPQGKPAQGLMGLQNMLYGNR